MDYFLAIVLIFIVSVFSFKFIEQPFRDKTFLITGKLNGISRAEAKSKIEKQSGKILSSVNKNLNYLITGDKPTVKKINKAKELSILILDQKDFIKLFN